MISRSHATRPSNIGRTTISVQCTQGVLQVLSLHAETMDSRELVREIQLRSSGPRANLGAVWEVI